MNPSSPLAVARERVAALQASLTATDGVPATLIETHISWLLLGRTTVYKLKKPLRLSFLDGTTLAARRRFCEEELRLNRRLAPSLYLDVVEVCDNGQGPTFGGPGTVLDVAVHMRRFPEGALWRDMLRADTLAPHHVDAMAKTLAAFHRDAAVAPAGSAFGSAAAHAQVVQGLEETVETPALRAWMAGQLQALAPWWAARQREGHVRECHGDLHLGNVLQLEGQATAFDGIEFDPALRWIDVVDDIAFLAMDLLANDRRQLAFRFINAYLSASGDYDALPGLRFAMVCRALVRAQVTTLAERQGVQAVGAGDASAYLALAEALSTAGDARLAITHGLPGSGKSFVSQGVLEAAGAICVRSDVERKRLFGLEAHASSRDRVPGGIYDAATTHRTYARLQQVAETALRAGWPVIVDAAFLRHSERAAFAALAAAMGVPFAVLDCRAALPLLRQRVQARQAVGTDPSEADLAVLEKLAGADEALSASERAAAIVADADAPAPVSPQAIAAQWLAAS
ncbi:bifunctional aminoglycoside phosphotransferase/ATP-binding protein [Variovorax arabinosiphilus]|uniref:bifunctional aminoglycoside phosphotransferase/ATP-binding protein n=1 Tax=Variovorax arabinosiphilus TaxID=3053498 RepID=UPI002575DA0E|nr:MULTISPECIES: bifunctional aminoglycoside phosphotransferase/ATP-binding protein [unclassified Variovorax]MDM0118215.1 AAA family ATPase [Variovorax sp. J2L1-78]MDM0128640.1 AAA family ATPase [Variovorax sp. J2L1-63]MDM0233574.1 AAA family ATPase [Variovorax sp. J2R1-6]